MTKAAVLEREKRSTAGTRMSALVGKAAEDDELFWSHSTWKDDDASPSSKKNKENGDDEDEVSSDGSFHDSDEEEENKVDTFDSDFDDSESEEEDENDDGAGDEEDENGVLKKRVVTLSKEEAQLRQDERVEQRSKKQGAYREPKSTAAQRKMADMVKAGRLLIQKRKGGISTVKKDIVRGDGLNAGLILNAPGSIPAVNLPMMTAPSSTATSIDPIANNDTTTSSTTCIPPTLSSDTIPIQTITEPIQPPKRGRRKTVLGTFTRKSSRTSTIISSTALSLQSSSADADRESSSPVPTTTVSNKQKRKRNFTQEELLLEAIHTTEAENERWILGRKRIKDEEESRAEIFKKTESKGKIICKFNSRRGCYNTITFPEMDSVPRIFTVKHVMDAERQTEIERIQNDNRCVITGKVARYRDPKTNKGYHDLIAFKELRRRFEAGEPIEQQIVNTNTNISGKDESVPSKLSSHSSDQIASLTASISHSDLKCNSSNIEKKESTTITSTHESFTIYNTIPSPIEGQTKNHTDNVNTSSSGKEKEYKTDLSSVEKVDHVSVNDLEPKSHPPIVTEVSKSDIAHSELNHMSNKSESNSNGKIRHVVSSNITENNAHTNLQGSSLENTQNVQEIALHEDSINHSTPGLKSESNGEGIVHAKIESQKLHAKDNRSMVDTNILPTQHVAQVNSAPMNTTTILSTNTPHNNTFPCVPFMHNSTIPLLHCSIPSTFDSSSLFAMNQMNSIHQQYNQMYTGHFQSVIPNTVQSYPSDNIKQAINNEPHTSQLEPQNSQKNGEPKNGTK